jgi:hypothetical protein
VKWWDYQQQQDEVLHIQRLRAGRLARQQGKPPPSPLAPQEQPPPQ